jgi:hypothetical protein
MAIDDWFELKKWHTTAASMAEAIALHEIKLLQKYCESYK